MSAAATPSTGRRTTVRGRLVAGGLALALLALGGCGAAGTGPEAGPGAPAVPGAPAAPGSPTPSSSPAALAGGAAAAAAGGFQDPTGALPADPVRPGVVPVRVEIPAIGVRSRLERLGLAPDGRVAAPVRWERAGWFDGAVVPGDAGPAVLAGHVDSPSGPAVFWRLRELRAGDEVAVTLSDGRVARFAVDRAAQVPKSDFPTSAVYGPTPDAQLRLVTCGGAFDHDAGHYLDNLVVFATRTSLS